MNEIVAVDIGGTHARFALATLRPGAPPQLQRTVKLKTAHFASLEAAWAAFGEEIGQPLPTAAAVAVACPVTGDELRLTNNPWIIRPSALRSELARDRLVMINDFGAIGHAIGWLQADHLTHVSGPAGGLPAEGAISVIGPGTGLGVAMLLRRAGQTHVLETEGGHIGFAPEDSVDRAILERLQQRYLRVSVERIVSGPGLAHIYEALAALQGEAVHLLDDPTLWQQAIDGSNALARTALERFCMNLGSVCGDLALAHGSKAVVLAGGLAPRFVDLLCTSSFASRFTSKGRFVSLMESVPVLVCTHPDPGLLGAAAAFAATV